MCAISRIFFVPLAGERRTHHLADFLGCVFHFVNIARFHQLDRAAEHFQPSNDDVGKFAKAFEITAAALDGHQRF
jgi:hypothetical protein